MEYLKYLLLIAALMMSQAVARHPGHQRGLALGHGHEHGMGPHPGQGQGNGRFEVNANLNGPIPGFPQKGPPSVPYVPQERPIAEPRQVPSIYPGPGYNGAQNTYPNNNLPIYVNNPFLPQQNAQGQGSQNTNNNVPKRFEEYNNLPAIEPVTNDLPQASVEPAKPTINPREFDLLYGSNLNLDQQNAQQNSQQTAQPRQNEPVKEPTFNFDDRILIDTAPHCTPPYKLVGTVCRRMV